jgi:hypothetical protein
VEEKRPMQDEAFSPAVARAAAPQEAVCYRLSHRGFFSEFNILAYAHADCLAHGRRLYVDERTSPMAWRELFSAFPPSVEELDASAFAAVIGMAPKASDGAWRAMRQRVRDACLQRRTVEAPAIGFDGPFDELVFWAARALFRPQPDLVAEAAAARRDLGLVGPFSAVQIRRGDKTEGYLNGRGERVVETTKTPFVVYAECLERLAPGVRDVLVLTDDYGAFEEARAAHPDLSLRTLCAPSERGYFHADHLVQPPEQRFADLRKLIVSVILARDSAAFVGTFWSNLSTAVCMLHADRSRCASIDLEQEWPAFDPLFLRGRDTLSA